MNLKLICKLPKEIEDIIYEYMPINIRILLNKTNYVLYRDEYIYYKFNNGRENPYIFKRKPLYKKYVNNIIKKDMYFIMKFIYKSNNEIWKSRYRIHDKHIRGIRRYKNELNYYKALSRDYKSNKCLNILLFDLNSVYV